jgi:Bacterial archaeo-eukaryotic release factor family 10
VSEYSPLLALFALAPDLRRATDETLSLYVAARSEGYDSRHYDIEVRELVKRYRDRLSEKERKVMDRELPRLRAHLAVMRPAACPALAGFADEAAGILDIIPLRAATDPRLEVGEPLMAPILRQLDEFPPALVAVVDKEQGMTFAAILGDLRPLEHLVGDEVRRSRSGGTSASSNQRKADNLTRANLERIVSTVEHEMGTGAYNGLYIAGTTEARALLEQLLPPSLRSKIAGRLPALLDSPTLQHELRNRLLAAGSVKA